MVLKSEYYLTKGDKLALNLNYPLSPADIKKVKGIYANIIDYGPAPPLILAAEMGLEKIAKAFIECAKQNNTNLDTGETGDGEFQKFLWLSKISYKTALDVAVEKNHVKIAKLVLKNASLERLISYRNIEGVLPVSVLSDEPEHDKFIFEILEEATRKEVYPPTSTTVISIDDDHRQQQQGRSLEYNEIPMCARYPATYLRSDFELCMSNLESGLIEVTPNKNTILHLASEWGDVDCVKKILLKDHTTCLLYRRNSEGETAAFIAAREGNVDIVAIMISYFKKETESIEQFVTRDTDKHTALHIAIQNHHVGVVFWLLQEIPQLINCVNDFGVIPHFLAAERGFRHILKKVFPTCNKRDFTTSNGQTTLHAAAIYGSSGCIRIVVNSSKDLIDKKDERGWTPLLYAIYHNNPLATEALLDVDSSMGYKMLKENDITTSPIHIAACQGHCDVIKVLISNCPPCLDITYGNGRNILHFAIEHKKLEVIKLIFNYKLLGRLINQRDGDGNTPIHLFMKSDFETTEVIMNSMVDIKALNNENRTPLDVASSKEKKERLLKDIGNVRDKIYLTGTSFPREFNLSRVYVERRQREEEKLKLEKEAKLKEYEKEFAPYWKVVENIILVTTLIVTATFAAGFTVPGGFNSNEGSKNQGMPILLKKAAYKAFVVTNTIAFSCACSVLIGYIWMLFQRVDTQYDYISVDVLKKKIEARLGVIYFLTGVALISMAIAFVTGIYVVLTPSAGLAISLCVMSLFIMVFMTVRPDNFEIFFRWLNFKKDTRTF